MTPTSTCSRCGCHLPNPDCYVCWDNGKSILDKLARDEWEEAQADARRDDLWIEEQTTKNDEQD